MFEEFFSFPLLGIYFHICMYSTIISSSFLFQPLVIIYPTKLPTMIDIVIIIFDVKRACVQYRNQWCDWNCNVPPKSRSWGRKKVKTCNVIDEFKQNLHTQAVPFVLN